MCAKTILLGAGASMDAGLPGAKELARKAYGGRERSTASVGPVEVAIGGLQFFRATTGADPFDDVDVEDVYSTLTLLSDRHAHLLAPFVSAWIPQVLAAEAAHSKTTASRFIETLADQVQNIAEGAAKNSVHRDLFDRRRTLQAFQEVIRLDTEVFRHAASDLIEQLGRHLWIHDPTRVDYLVPLLETARSEPLWIASLNYDNAIEMAAKTAGLSLDFGVGRPDGDVIFDASSEICLAKLHGSLNWENGDGGIRIAERPQRWPALIFGVENKLRIEGPYLDLLFKFRERLRMSSELVVCGYSFRDAHLNHLLLRWLGADRARMLHVVDPTLTTGDIANRVFRKRPGWDNFGNQVKVRAATTREWIEAGSPT